MRIEGTSVDRDRFSNQYYFSSVAKSLVGKKGRRKAKRDGGCSSRFVRNEYYPLESTSGTKLANYSTVISHTMKSCNEIKLEESSARIEDRGMQEQGLRKF